MGQSCTSKINNIVNDKNVISRADNKQYSKEAKDTKDHTEKNARCRTDGSMMGNDVEAAEDSAANNIRQFGVVHAIQSLQHSMKPAAPVVSTDLLHEDFRQFSAMFKPRTSALSVASCHRTGRSRSFLAGGEDCSIALIGYETGHVMRRWVYAHDKDINKITRPLASGVFASCSRDTTVKVWGIEDDHPIATFTGHTMNVPSIDVHPSGNLLVSGSKDSTVRLWDLGTQSELSCGNISLNSVHFVCFLPSMSCVLQGGEDLSVRVWDVRTDGTGLTLSSTLIGMDYHPISCELLPDRPHSFLTGHNCANTSGSYISQWDIRMGKRIHVYEGHTGAVTNLCAAPTKLYGSDMFISTSDDNSIGMWTVAADAAMEKVHLSTDHRFIVPEGRITGCDCDEDGDLITAHAGGCISVFRPVKQEGSIIPTQRYRYIGVASNQ